MTNPLNPFVYGRVLSASDAACPRPQYEVAILETVRNTGRLALVGDRRLGKSSLVERTLEAHKQRVLRWDFQQLLSIEDLIRRCAEDFDAFVRASSPVARRVTPWLREVGVGIQSIRVSYHGTGASLNIGAPTDHLKRLLGYVAQVARRRPFSLFIDELQDVRERLPRREGDAVLGILRSEIQRLRIPCFFAGSFRASFRGLFISESSPFYESARLMEVGPIPPEDFGRHLICRFAEGGFELSQETLSMLLSIGGDSPNDVQHLAHESWNFCSRRPVSATELQLALAKILADLAPMGDAWLAPLTQRQTRALLATAFHEDLGAGTAEFMRAVGARSSGAVASALRPCLQGPDPIVEKVGARYRVRSRFLRLWLCGRRLLVQELLPSLRADADYRAALRRVCPALIALEAPS